MTYKPKLIEVALPLMAINLESKKQKTMGAASHPQSLHRWWARRPLAAARAVLWSSLVDDPSGDDQLSEAEQQAERDRLFGILERLILWKNSENSAVLESARAEIKRCFPDGVPPVIDPFGGGGAIPIEAQRLGLEVISGDLNPVAVLIQKAMIDVPYRFAGRRPVNPRLANELAQWGRATGLAADVAEYGADLARRAEERIGRHYPRPADNPEAKPLIWIWAHTVASPDPSWPGSVPLVRSWILSKKKGKPVVWVEPVIDRASHEIAYVVRHGGEPISPSIDGGVGTCIATGAAISGDFIKHEASAGRMGSHLLAIVAEGPNGRMYVSPSPADVSAAAVDPPEWKPAGRNPEKLTGGTVTPYGFDEWWKLFTPRQLLAGTTFSDELKSIAADVLQDAIEAGLADDGKRLSEGGEGAQAYADAVTTYLAFVVDKCVEHWTWMCTWHNGNEQLRNAFGRQAIPMTWDYCEANPFSGRMASWASQLSGVVKAVRDCLVPPGSSPGRAEQVDARANMAKHSPVVLSTDPPYAENISYADIADFFFAWMRRNLSDVWPNECATLATPKAGELIANRHRQGSLRAAEEYFQEGMGEFMRAVAASQANGVPATIYYAYKATETRDGVKGSTGWSTFLQAIIDAGIQVTATWPMRTELGKRLVASGTNALASSIVLACRPRATGAPMATRAEFVAALRSELPGAIRLLQSGSIAPVDLPQSTIGPGIGVFSRYSRVVEADGSAMPVWSALAIINDELGEILDGEESEMDKDSRFALSWYSQHGYNAGDSGDAISLAQAKDTSLTGLEEAGIGETRRGEFSLRRREQLAPDWTFLGDKRPTVWETTQYLIAALERSESEAASLLHTLGGYGERARQLAYLLFKTSSDRGWVVEAAAYNSLIAAMPALRSAGVSSGDEVTQTPELDFETRGDD